METVILAIAFMVVFIAGFIQGLVGFGSGLVSVPLLSIFLGPKTVVPLTLVHGLLMNMYLSVRNRRSIQWHRVLPLFISGVLGIPLGVALHIFLPSYVLKIFIGVVITVFALLLLTGYSRRSSRERIVIPPVGFISGILNGSISMSGPPVILFFSNQGMGKEHFRADLVTYFFLLNIVTFMVFIVTGIMNFEVLLLSFVLMFPLPLGIVIGEAASKRVSEKMFRSIALILVLGAGLSAIVTAMIAFV